MEIILPDLTKKVIGDLVDEVKELEGKKKELMKLYIEPIDERIDVIKQKIIFEWRVAPAEKKFFGVTNTTAHATVSQSIKKTLDLEGVLKDVLGVVDANPETLAKAMKMTLEDFTTKYITEKKGNASVRIY